MDSFIPGEGGYATEGGLANPWSNQSQYPGLTELIRGYNGNTGDHALMTPDAPLAGYSWEHLGLWGYERYSNSAERLLPLSAGGVSINSNQVAGGSLWSWTYRGTQYINHSDYGREVQASVFPIADNSICQEPGNPNSNPTEAGDSISGSSLQPGNSHGSPAVTFYNDTSNPTSPLQVTRAIPLEWSPSTFSGGSDNPVARAQMQLGKNVTLNFNGMGPVARYTTAVVSPVAMGAFWETAGYLQPQFNNFRGYDSAAAAEVGLYPPANSNAGADFYPGSGAGGVIIADSTGANAMGVYGRTTAAGGDITLFRVFNYPGIASPTSKWQVARHLTLPSGYSFWNQYIITGSVTEVEVDMRALYNAGY